jgi:hypothetical protein
MKQTLKEHYEKVNKMEMIYDKFHEEYQDIDWLINHQIYLNSNTDNFAVYKIFPMIGYSSDTVVICYIKPQLTEINYNEILLQSLFDTYLVQNVKEKMNDSISENYCRFSDKKVVTVVLAPNLNKPYYFKWGDLTTKYMDEIKLVIRDFLKEHYKCGNKMLYQFYLYWKKNKKMKSKEFIKFLVNKYYNSKYDAELTKIFFPNYITEFMTKLKFEIEQSSKGERKNKLNQYCQEEVFMNNINIILEESIGSFLGIEEDSESDSDESTTEEE